MPQPWERAYRALVSPKVAIALLVLVLICCVVGVTAFAPSRAWEVIFSALWFNSLLVLLAVSAGAAFFSRIWKRKLTLVSAGMILFHLSFMALLGGVVYNSLFHFKGAMRITEGETLRNGDPESYDTIERGRFFDLGTLRGETTLVRMHRDYTVAGQNKRAAYELLIGEGEAAKQAVIYITEYFEADGFRYFCSKEGYSVLVVAHDKAGKEMYGAHVPLQSLRQGDGPRLYATGTSEGQGAFPFPPPPEQARTQLLVTYRPSTVEERAGDVTFQVWPPEADPAAGAGGSAGVRERSGTVTVGGRFDAGEIELEAREIRYWVGMDVRHDPGLHFSLGSLVTGLLGMVLTFVGRLRQGPRKREPEGQAAQVAR